jgi:hypothetical protein
MPGPLCGNNVGPTIAFGSAATLDQAKFFTRGRVFGICLTSAAYSLLFCLVFGFASTAFSFSRLHSGAG